MERTMGIADVLEETREGENGVVVPHASKVDFPGSSFSRVSSLDCGRGNFGNFIIHGDNLPALQALTPALRSQVRCIYIDPPYNNRETYTHYSDREEHSRWLEGLVARISIMHKLLRDDGSLWVSIDDRELHYLKVALDGVFGRTNFVHTMVWEHRVSRENRRVFSNNHEYILVYARNLNSFKRTRNLLERGSDTLGNYRNPDQDPRGLWQSVSANVQAGHATPSQFYRLRSPKGYTHRPPPGRCWIYSKERMLREMEAGNLYFGRHGKGVPRLKRFLTDARKGLNPETLWLAGDVGTSDTAKKHLLDLFPSKPVFDTPKPEALIARILSIATSPGDTVLDAFLGSGTTAAVAHKMGRRYVGIESGQHVVSHCAARLRKVVTGEQGGISKSVSWQGGGGFGFFRLSDPGFRPKSEPLRASV